MQSLAITVGLQPGARVIKGDFQGDDLCHEIVDK
jgi:hypothetical protein